MYTPLALNGLKTRPGLPGTGFATGNCVAVVGFRDDGEDFVDGLLAATRDGAFADCCFDLCEAERGFAVGTATGRPGFVTSDVLVAGVGSGSLATYRTGAVRVRPMLCAAWQPTKQVASITIAQRLELIAVLYRLLSSAQHIANETIDSRVIRRP